QLHKVAKVLGAFVAEGDQVDAARAEQRGVSPLRGSVVGDLSVGRPRPTGRATRRHGGDSQGRRTGRCDSRVVWADVGGGFAAARRIRQRLSSAGPRTHALDAGQGIVHVRDDSTGAATQRRQTCGGGDEQRIGTNAPFPGPSSRYGTY